MKKGFWQSDWLFGLIITIAFVLIGPSQFIQNLERSAYDLGVRLSHRDAGGQVSVIAIDDQSIENIGRWPWPRDIIADMIDVLHDAGAKVIASTIILSEPQENPVTGLINEAVTELQSPEVEALRNYRVDAATDKLLQAQTLVNTDSILGNSIENAASVVLGMQFTLGQALGKPDKAQPDYVLSSRLANALGDAGNPPFANAAKPPIEILAQRAAGIGHASTPIDPDGSVRNDLLVVDYYNDYYPSLALMVAAKSLNLGPEDILVKLGESVNLANLEIKTDSYSRMYPFFYQDESGDSVFKVSSFYDVREGKIKAENFKDKIVIIGATAYGVGTSFVTPTDENMSPAVLLANVTASILNQHFFILPDWGLFARLGSFALVALFLIVLLPRLSAKMAALSSVVLLALILGVQQYLLVSMAMWIKLMLPATLLAAGYLLLITKRYLVTEKGKIKADEASAQSNRTLGLAYQQQGQLDMALDKFKACPLDDSMLEPLYNLATDFESKRQFNKATSVYEYMASYDKNYRDIAKRIDRSKKMQDTVMFGSPGAGIGSTMMLDGDDLQKPKLGKFEIEKELGKGAMGVVYLGKDPVINRNVAIKTMALSQEFEADEIDEVKSRFFREAETAGRLSHPNIVGIYDVGEEHDLAFIAMEFLEGHDLARYTKAENLLPIKTVLGIIATAADALSYAHAENVVHRDIKPANIMYVPSSKKIKLTDFGIARITDSSKTKTGMVLGTPSYMSPEQLSGKHIDGRSDLFSLGVMLYQMLSGKLPFTGDSMATLMFKIANDPHPEIIAINPEIAQKAPCVVNIINKSLEKSQEARYQDGAEMASDIRKCAKSL